MSTSGLGRQREVLEWVCAQIAEVVGGAPADVDVDRSFAALGVDSVEGSAIVDDLSDQVGVPLDVALLFEHPTVEDFVAAVLAVAGAEPAPATGAHLPPPPQAEARPVAIVGMACRTPLAASAQGFWEALLDGRDGVREVPAERWGLDGSEVTLLEDGVRHVGLLPAVDQFDAGFFGMAQEEALRTDPQQRLLLETSWEAFEDAQIDPDRLRGSPTSVFVGISTNDYGRRQLDGLVDVHALTPTSNALSTAANRISFAYDFRGPSMAVDTACSSSLVALHLAVRSLRAGESTLALVAGVNLILEPEISQALARAGMLAADGRCKFFDAGANGYVRGEGCVALVLKPLERAVADRDRIYATVAGTGVNQDGRTNGLTSPNPQAQEAVLGAAYADAGIDPAAVGYVECHGTGTLLGDPIEARSLGHVVGAGRSEPCLVGSVKSNIGHLEAAAGAAGLMKAALCVFHGRIPQSLHFRAPNPNIPPPDQLGLQLVTTATDWPAGDGPRVAGVSSFGFGGTNAHAVLAQAPSPVEARPPTEQRLTLLPVSGRHPDALAAFATAVADTLERDPDLLAPLAGAVSHRRSHHPQRAAVVGETAEELVRQLRSLPAGTGRGRRHRPQVAFVFSGQVAIPGPTILRLAADQPMFAASLRRSEEILTELAGFSLFDVLGDTGKATAGVVAQPALVATQVALADAWRSLGVRPVAVAGHSVGEVSAAVAAGALSLEGALQIAVERGRSADEACGTGRMLAAGISPDEARSVLERFDGAVELAVVNSPRSVVFSGDELLLTTFHGELMGHGRIARWIPVDYPSHSRWMEGPAKRLAEAVGDVAHQAATIPWISSVTRGVLAETLDASYWATNLRQPVDLLGATQTLLDHADTLVEISPVPVLRGPLRDSVPEARDDTTIVASLAGNDDPWRDLLDAAGQLYQAGLDLRWSATAPRGARCELPGYPWQRRRYWLAGGAPSRPSATHRHPLLGDHLPLAAGGPTCWQIEAEARYLPLVADHKVLGRVVMPAAGFVEMFLAAARDAGVDGPVELRDVAFHRFLGLDERRVVQTTVEPAPDGLRLVVHSREPGSQQWLRHASATAGPAATGPAAFDGDDERRRCSEPVAVPALYGDLWQRGLEYGPTYRTVAGAWRGADTAMGTLRSDGDPRLVCDPRLLDGAFHLLSLLDGGDGTATMVPTSIERLVVHGPPSGPLTAIAERATSTGAIRVAAGDHTWVEVAGIGFTPLAAPGEGGAWCYQTTWRPEPADAACPARPDGRVVVLLTDDEHVGGQVADRLTADGAQVILAPTSLGAERGQARRLLAEVEESIGQPVGDLVHMGHLAPADGPDPAPAAAQLVELCRTAAGAARPPRLWLLTAGAQPVLGDGDVVNCTAAALGALVRVAPFELPALQFRWIDVAGPGEVADAVVAELAAPSQDTEIAFRGGQRHVKRLTATPAPMATGASFPIDAARSYLVTGGLGALGLATARRLVARGARHIGLLGRTAPSPEAAQAVEQLREQGARVEVLQADVADPEELGPALDRLRALAPLGGVVHAAGALHDGALLDLDEAAIRRTTRPKADGTLLLHSLTAPDDLAWIVHLSSAAAVLGSPGQGNYCIANAFLDAAACRARAAGRTVVDVNWGPWAEVGLAEAAGWSTQTGFASFDVDHGLDLLEALVEMAAPQLLVLPFDLADLLLYFPGGLGFAPLAELAGAQGNLRVAGAGPLPRPDLRHEYVAPRTSLEQRIAAIWRSSLGYEQIGVSDGFFELGGDSVLANQILLDVGRELGVEIDTEAAFANLTIAALADMAETAMAQAVESMSEDDVARLLAMSEPPDAGG